MHVRSLTRALRTTSLGLPSCLRAHPRALVPRPLGYASSSSATRFSPKPLRPLEASSSILGLVAAASLAAASLYFFTYSYPAESQAEKTPSLAAESPTVAAVEINSMATDAPGRVHNLTLEEEEKLRQLWAALFRVYKYDFESVGGADDDAGDTLESVPSTTAATNGTKTEKKKRSLFKRSKTNGSDNSVAAVTKGVSHVDLDAVSQDDKYGQSKQFQEALASLSPEAIRATVWSMVKHDHPDALLLRFLRARKWDIEKALVMLVSTMHWRSQEMHVDDIIMPKGEAGALEDMTTSTDATAKEVGAGFMEQMRIGKSFLHGCDKAGRPICVVRVRLHHQGDQVEDSVERCTVYTIETARMMLRPPVDTATIIFDMTGFTMANMDYSPVKFMIKCFEANFPECLGAVLVHKAPWLFQGIWRIIRGWLDPVVASKVHFTNNAKDMEAFIAKDRIIKELGGTEDWQYKYVEPEPGENDKMKDTATRDKLLAEHDEICRTYEAATARWVLHPATTAEQMKAVRTERDAIARKMHDSFWVLDPYLRARSLYDRIGVLQGAKVDFYWPLEQDEITQTDGNGVAQATK